MAWIRSEFIKAGAVAAASLANLSVTQGKIALLAVDTAQLAADAVDGTKIKDDAVDSEHIAGGAIDTEHFAAGAVDTAALKESAVGYVQLDPSILEVATGEIAAGAVATLFTSPIEVIPAPAAGSYVEVISCHWWLDFVSAAYDGAAAGETLGLKYTDASGAACVDVVAGDAIGAAAADYHVTVQAAPEVIPVTDAAIVAHIDSAEWFASAGDSPLKYEIYYRVRTFGFATA